MGDLNGSDGSLAGFQRGIVTPVLHQLGGSRWAGRGVCISAGSDRYRYPPPNNRRECRAPKGLQNPRRGFDYLRACQTWGFSLIGKALALHVRVRGSIPRSSTNQWSGSLRVLISPAAIKALNKTHVDAGVKPSPDRQTMLSTTNGWSPDFQSGSRKTIAGSIPAGSTKQ